MIYEIWNMRIVWLFTNRKHALTGPSKNQREWPRKRRQYSWKTRLCVTGVGVWHSLTSALSLDRKHLRAAWERDNERTTNESPSWYSKQIILHTFVYKQLRFRPPEPQIFDNRSNLASNCRTSNRKFLAIFEPPIRNS